MLRTAVITSALILALAGCSDSTDPPELPGPGDLVEIDGPAQVDENAPAEFDD